MTGIRTEPVPTCPIDGAPMVLRRPNRHAQHKAFWGCRNYPACKGTRQIMDDGRPEGEDEEWMKS